MRNRISLLLIIFSCGGLCYGQQGSEAYKPMQFISDGDSLNYRILYPEGFDPSKRYPVVLFLHGAGERGSDNQKQLVHGSELFLEESIRTNYPSVVIFPQCPRNSYWSNAEVKREPGRVYLAFQHGGDPTVPMKLVMSLMDSIQSLPYSADSQLYVGGLSMGGMGTFEILYRKPDLFAAAFPICGGGNPESVKSYASNTSVWVFHGARDNVVLPSHSTEMVIALMKAGADVKYTLYQEANHNSWDAAFSEPELIPWLFSKTKK